MKAMVITEFGRPEVFEERTLPEPVPPAAQSVALKTTKSKPAWNPADDQGASASPRARRRETAAL